MWTYTLYMLDAYIRRNKGKKSLDFKNFADFVFDDLWGKQLLVFHDTRADLQDDIDTIDKLGLIEFEKDSGKITISEEKYKMIRTLTEDFKNDPMREKVPMVDLYLRKIEQMIPST